jgi:hypothetical protein
MADIRVSRHANRRVPRPPALTGACVLQSGVALAERRHSAKSGLPVENAGRAADATREGAPVCNASRFAGVCHRRRGSLYRQRERGCRRSMNRRITVTNLRWGGNHDTLQAGFAVRLKCGHSFWRPTNILCATGVAKSLKTRGAVCRHGCSPTNDLTP